MQIIKLAVALVEQGFPVGTEPDAKFKWGIYQTNGSIWKQGDSVGPSIEFETTLPTSTYYATCERNGVSVRSADFPVDANPQQVMIPVPAEPLQVVVEYP